MKATTMLDTIRSLLGVPSCAIPLSLCKPARAYLLEKAGIPATGTAILFAIPYLMSADVKDPDRNLSLYAVPRDYHGYMKELENTLLPFLKTCFPAFRFALFSDHSPILEVDAAVRAGLGVMGMNGLLLTPAYGSFVFIGEVITDAGYEAVTGEPICSFSRNTPVCEACGACVAACPGGCCDGDRASCLSAVTQKKGDLTDDEIAAVRKGGLVWGCDACQLACPHNRAVIDSGIDTPIPYFRERRMIRVDTELLSSMDDATFLARAYAWRGRAVMIRNCSLFDDDTGKNRERSTP